MTLMADIQNWARDNASERRSWIRVGNVREQGTHFDLSENLYAEQVDEKNHEDDDRDPDCRVVLLVVPVLDGSDGGDNVVGSNDEVLQGVRGWDMDCQTSALRARTWANQLTLKR
jgi:hypothetical protein